MGRASGVQGGSREEYEEEVGRPRFRRSKPTLAIARGPSGSLVSGLGGPFKGGTSLKRRISRSFQTSHSTVLDLDHSSSLHSSGSHLDYPSATSTSPPIPSKSSFLIIPRPPPFFYNGNGANEDALDPNSTTTSSPTVPVAQGGSLRIRNTFIRSLSTASTESDFSEDSLEEAEIAFGERGRREWAGFHWSPVSTTFGAAITGEGELLCLLAGERVESLFSTHP